MRLRDLAGAVIGTLKANWLRSVLTLLGVIIGVGTLVSLSSVMAGGLDAIARTVSSASGEDVVRVGIDRWDPRAKDDPALTLADRDAIARLRALTGGGVLAQLKAEAVSARANGALERAPLVGTTEAAVGLYRLEVGAGRFLTADDRAERRRVAVVGGALAQALKLPERAPFGEIALDGERFRVVGRLGAKPGLNIDNFNWNRAVAIPETTFVALRGQGGLETILARTAADAQADPERLPALKRAIGALLVARRHPAETLQIKGGGDQNAGEAGFMAALRSLMIAVAVVCMLAGGINLMNIMLVSVTERKREIGLRLALGARKRDIQRQFLLEAAALAGAGSLLGLLSGLALGFLASQVLSLTLGYWPYRVDWATAAVGCGAAILTGVVFGFYPARRAAGLSPIDCLRSE